MQRNRRRQMPMRVVAEPSPRRDVSLAGPVCGLAVWLQEHALPRGSEAGQRCGSPDRLEIGQRWPSSVLSPRLGRRAERGLTHVLQEVKVVGSRAGMTSVVERSAEADNAAGG